MRFFSKLNNLFFGYFDPVIVFFIIKINNFRGDLSDISAKTATLIGYSRHCDQKRNTVHDRVLFQSVLLFPKLYYCCETLILKLCILSNKVKRFRGDLTDTSARAKTLIPVSGSIGQWNLPQCRFNRVLFPILLGRGSHTSRI